MVSKKILRMGVQKTPVQKHEISTGSNSIYILTNENKYLVDNATQKHLLYKQFVAWSCDGCSTAPLTDYVHNLVYQELIEETDYFGNKSHERAYFDLRASAGYTNQMENWNKTIQK